MKMASANLEFERAQRYKEKLDTLERFQSKSLVVNRDLTDIDVFTITSTEAYAYVNYLQVKEGSIIYSKTVELKKKLDESDEDLLSFSVWELREQTNSDNNVIFSNIPIVVPEENIENIVPKIGDKKKLLALSIKNALELKKDKEISARRKKIETKRSTHYPAKRSCSSKIYPMSLNALIIQISKVQSQSHLWCGLLMANLKKKVIDISILKPSKVPMISRR